MYWNIYSIPGIIATIITLFVGLYVFRENPKNIQNRVFILFSFFVIIFCFGEAILRGIHNAENALLVGRIAYIGTFFVPITFLHLSFIFPKDVFITKSRKLKGYWYIYLIYIIGSILYIIFNINVRLNNISNSSWGYRLSLNSSPYMILFGLFIMIVLIIAIINLIKNYTISESNIEKKQIRFVFYGGIAAVLLTILTNITASILGLEIFPMSTIGQSIFVFFIGLAILRYDLFQYKPMTETVISSEKLSLLNRDELEKEVKARTSALIKINKNLESEIEERKKAEKKIMESLYEKELLLKEIHHRVKNNLQIISSLIYLQGKNVNKKNFNDAFIDIQNRIKSMSLIHETLYNSSDLLEINLKDYVEKLIMGLFGSYGIKPDRISLSISIENIYLPVDIASPCGLIINEIISNSLKHAFPNEQKGKISVMMKNENNIIKLIINDNGVGLPKDFNINKLDTLGLRLINNIVNQLNGTIEISNKNKTEFKIEFPISK